MTSLHAVPAAHHLLSMWPRCYAVYWYYILVFKVMRVLDFMSVRIVTTGTVKTYSHETYKILHHGVNRGTHAYPSHKREIRLLLMQVMKMKVREIPN